MKKPVLPALVPLYWVQLYSDVGEPHYFTCLVTISAGQARDYAADHSSVRGDSRYRVVYVDEFNDVCVVDEIWQNGVRLTEEVFVDL